MQIIPTSFSLFIEALISCLKNLNVGIVVADLIVFIFMYADDLVFLAEDEKDLQKLHAQAGMILHFRVIVRNEYQKNKICYFLRKSKVSPLNKQHDLQFTCGVHSHKSA